MNKILVTGATGFIGSFIVEEALRRDMEVWAAVRPTSSRRYLQDERIHFIELDLSSEERLIEQMRGHEFQYVVHAAGATKCINRDDFFRTNTLGTQNLVEALLKLNMPLKRFVFISSLSVFGAIHEAVGFKRQDITFVYVEDVVQAVFLALDHGMSGRRYFLTDGGVYQSTEFSDLIRRALGNPWMLRIKAPVWVLRIVTAIGERWAHITGKISALNNDKYNILKQRNWRCDIEPAMDELGYHPHFDLQRGVDLTIKWYKDNKWL